MTLAGILNPQFPFKIYHTFITLFDGKTLDNIKIQNDHFLSARVLLIQSRPSYSPVPSVPMHACTFHFRSLILPMSIDDVTELVSIAQGKSALLANTRITAFSGQSSENFKKKNQIHRSEPHLHLNNWDTKCIRNLS